MSSEANQLDKIRHSLAHVLAMAVLEKFPDAKLAIGPVIEHGFYYDFLLPGVVGEADFTELEKSMRRIINKKTEFSGKKITPDEAKKMFAGQQFKLELIDEFSADGKELTAYTSGSFTDLCRGGHVENTSEIDAGAFKIMKTAGAYWRGSEKNPMLTRIYAVAFETAADLDAHLKLLDEAEKRDHKKLGPELDLFVFSELVGSGLPLWTPRGTLLRQTLDAFVWELRERAGYERVEIPHITKKELYEKSGHWDKFKDELFRITTREGHLFAMKPMNCPHHTQIYDRKLWSYRELPQRYANTTMCYRDEQSGELAGLSRARSFTQDDAHVFCRLSQAKEEFLKVWDIVHEFYKAFGFTLRVRLSVHDPATPEKYLGGADRWSVAEAMLREIIAEKKVEAIDGVGEAAFYGPKLDFMAKDSIGREWQVATIQLDMNMPERFDLVCVNEKGEKERIVMIHAAIMGSIERFLAIAIEHFAGAFPVWLSPTQVVVVPISDKLVPYAKQVAQSLREKGVRVEMDESNETLGKKIRAAEKRKTPYIAVVGAKEEEAKSVSVRERTKGDAGAIPVDDFIAKLTQEIKSRT
jgi:threonyl-tRNA synthetase